MIHAAEIILYDENSNAISIDLSHTQLTAICKILGLQMENGDVIYYSDDSLNEIISKTIDRFVKVKKANS